MTTIADGPDGPPGQGYALALDETEVARYQLMAEQARARGRR